MIETALLVVVLAAPQAPAQKPATSAAPTLARRIPDATVFFRVPDAKATDRAWQSLALTKLGEDPEVKDFLCSNPEVARVYGKDPLAALKIRLSGGAPDFPVDILNELASLVTEGESAFAIRTGAPGETEPEIYATVGLASSSFSTFDGALEKVAEWLRNHTDKVVVRRVSVDGLGFMEVRPARGGDAAKGSGVHVARRGSVACFAGPTREAMVRLLGPAGARSLADSPNFIEAERSLLTRPGSMYVYVDGPAVLAQIEHENGARHALKAMGLQGLRWAGLTFEPDGEFLRHRLEIRTDGKDSVLELFSTKNAFELAQVTPPRTVFFLQGAIDAKRILGGLRKMNATYNKDDRDGQGYERAMASMKERVGTNFDEMSGLIGDEAAFAVAMPEAGLLPDVYLLVRAAGVDAAAKLAELVESAVRRQTQAPLGETPYLGKRIVYHQGHRNVPFKPSFTVDGDRLVIASTVPSMKRYLQFRSEGGPSLAATPGFAESIAALPSNGCTAYAWLDVPTLTRFAYGNFESIASMILSPADRDAGPRTPGRSPETDEDEVDVSATFDMSKLPSSEAVVRYMRPAALRVKVDTSGVSLESRAIF